MSDKLVLQESVGADIVQSDRVVLYHKNCYDGFCAAWLLHKVYPDAIFLPVNYGDDPPPQCKGRHVIIADFSFKRSVLEELNASCKSLLVLDHHKTAQTDLGGLPYCVFDMDKSGARLVQEYFKLPNHWLVDYTEDRDLWRWKLPYSKEINTALRMEKLKFGSWDELSNHEAHEIIPIGMTILEYENQLVHRHVEHAKTITICGHKVPATYSSVLHSEIGNKMLAVYGCEFSAVTMDGKKFSLRSNGFDVSEIAAKFGGGGHQKAAGFALPYAVYIDENLVLEPM